MLISGSTLDWWHGVILMMMYVAYIVFMFSTMSKGGNEEEDDDDDDEEEDEGGSFIKSLLTLDLVSLIVGNKKMNGTIGWTLLITATLILGASCYLLVYSCEGLGHSLDIPVYFIAVILAAAATSVPDTLISVRDGLKGNYDDAISNALGSNIFDICFALGFPLFLFTILNGPIEMSPEVVDNTSELRVFLLFSTIGAFFIFLFGKKLGILKASLLFSIYIIFLIYVIGSANDWEVLESLSTWMQNFAKSISISF